MQPTRQLILDILRAQGEATVDEITHALHSHMEITSVTVRHHLDVLRADDLVTQPTLRRHSSRGRPQLVYALTRKALDNVPNNYRGLAAAFLKQVKDSMPPAEVNVFFEGVADTMIADAAFESLPGESSLEARLSFAVDYLNQHGYDASWQIAEGEQPGYVLVTRNCPYHQLATEHGELCTIDLRLVSGIIGVAPRLIGRLADGQDACTYFLPATPDPVG